MNDERVVVVDVYVYLVILFSYLIGVGWASVEFVESFTDIEICTPSDAEPSCTFKRIITFTGAPGDVTQFGQEVVTDDEDGGGILTVFDARFGNSFVFWNLQYEVTVPDHWTESIEYHRDDTIFTNPTCPGCPTCDAKAVCGTFEGVSTGSPRILAKGICCLKSSDFAPLKFTAYRGDFVSNPPAGEPKIDDTLSSSHCFTESDLKLDIFSFGPANIFFDVEINITRDGVLIVQRTLDPYENNTFEEAGYTAQLLGQFAQTVSFPDLTNKLLSIPSAPLTGIGSDAVTVAVERNFRTLLLDREEVGPECNKVGVSQETLSNQGAFCINTRQNECIKQQISDKFLEDINSDTPRWAIYRGIPWLQGIPTTVSPDEMILRLPIKVATSLVVVKIITEVGGPVRDLNSNASAIIVGATSTILTTGTSFAEVVVNILNTDTIGGNFLISLDCRPSIVLQESIVQQSKTINAGSIATVIFQISAVRNLAATDQCLILLETKFGIFLDSRNITMVSVPFVSEFAAFGFEPGRAFGANVGVTPPPRLGLGDILVNGTLLLDLLQSVGNAISNIAFLGCACPNILEADTCFIKCGLMAVLGFVAVVLAGIALIVFVLGCSGCAFCRNCGACKWVCRCCCRVILNRGRRIFNS